MGLFNYLKENILVADGAMGTYFDTLMEDGHITSEECNTENPDLIMNIHREYIEAGANLIRTNTFSANRMLAISKGIDDEKLQDAYIKSLILNAIQIAMAAKNSSEAPVFVAASIGPIPEQLFTAYEYDEQAEYKMIIDTFLSIGMDIFLFETFPDIAIIEWAAEYIKSKNPKAFVMASFAINRTGYSNRGISLKRLMNRAQACTYIDSVGVNCVIGASHMHSLLQGSSLPVGKYIQAMPNSGYPQLIRGRAVYSDSADYFANKAAELVAMGVNIVGGCCGTTPSHIRALSQLLQSAKPIQRLDWDQENTDSLEAKTANNPFMRKLASGQTVIAAELDPPFDQNAEKLLEGAFTLKEHGVDIITLADSPLARTRADSMLLASKIASVVDIPVMPHISCRDRNRISMHSTMLGAHINGIRNMLLVTGDPVPRGELTNTKPVFDFNSINFMKYVENLNENIFQSDAISFGGALNQGLPNIEQNMLRMQKKIDAGASWFLSQPIYSDRDIETIATMKKRLDTKILCGIMPLVSYKNAMFISHEMPGIDVPEDIVNMYSPDMSRKEAEDVAIKISVSVAKKLLGIADGFYLMTPFNRVGLVSRLVDELKKL